MRILVAPQEYKGTLTAERAAAAIAEGVRRAIPDANLDVLPLADGGPGTVRALLEATGGELQRTEVQDPLGHLTEAEWGRLPDGTAVIEIAAAAGLVLVAEAERDPRITSTYGVGQLVVAALDAGARRIIIGLGGSATNDGGAGMAKSLGVRLLDAGGGELSAGGAALATLAHIDVSNIDPRIAETEVIGATDVRNPLTGPEGASIVYGPQKGATPEVARELDAALTHYAGIIERDLGISIAEVPGAGSAGGLGAGLIAFLRADIRPGIDVIAEAVHLRDHIHAADLIITGEGRLDGQTGYGKTVAGIAHLAREQGIPVIIVPGSLGEGWESMQPLARAIEPVDRENRPLPDDPAEALSQAVERACKGL